MIRFSRQEKEAIIPKIQTYMEQELDVDLGQFEAEFLLDFFIREVGPAFYNRALYDAQAVLQQQFDNLTDSLYQLEQQPPE